MDNLDIYKDNNPDNDKLLETKKVLDGIYKDLLSLKIDSNPEIVWNISNRLNNLENNSLEYSNLYQQEIRVLLDILKDYKWLTWKEGDILWVIDFEYNYKLFSEVIKEKIEKIKPSDISLLYTNKLSLINIDNQFSKKELTQKYYDYMFDLIEHIYRDHKNTKIVFIDIQFPEYFYKSFNDIQKYYNKDIKIILWATVESDLKKYNKHNLLYWSVDIDMKKNLWELPVEVIKSVLFKNKHSNHRWVIDDIITQNRNNLSISDTINLLINPRNLLKFRYGDKEKSWNKEYLSKDYKWTNHNFNKSYALDIGSANNIPDTKILIIWDYSKGWKETQDQFIDPFDWSLISWSELIANDIIDNDLNK